MPAAGDITADTDRDSENGVLVKRGVSPRGARPDPPKKRKRDEDQTKIKENGGGDRDQILTTPSSSFVLGQCGASNHIVVRCHAPIHYTTGGQRTDIMNGLSS